MNPSDTPGNPGSESMTRGTHARFHETRWTTVLAAVDSNSTAGQDALERLCRRYWYPLYAFVRRKGFAPAEAEDITQSFLLRVLSRQVLGQVNPDKGRFRNFLLACLTNFLHNWRDAGRSDRERLVWWDAQAPEERYQAEPADTSPEAIFDATWAVTLVAQVMEELRSEYAARDKGDLFRLLQPFLIGEVPDGAPARIAAELGRNVGTIKSDLSRLRGEFGVVLRREIRDTVAEPGEAEIKAEIRHLFAAIAAR